MVLVKSFRETRVNYSGTGIESFYLDIAVPLPADDHRGILPSQSIDNSVSWNGDTTIGLSENDDAEDTYYANFVATAGGSFTRTPTTADEPHTIVWRVLRQSTLLELDPVDLNMKTRHALRKIRIQTPAPFLDNCITVCENKGTGYLVIDFITKTNYLYTVTFSFSEFIVDQSNSLSDRGHSLTEENASNWRSIRYPFTFDFKKPQMLYAISHKELAASTTDGTLIHMKRDTALSFITTTPFTDSHTSQGIGRIFGWGNSDRVPGNSSFSQRSVVSMAAVPQARLLVTISINRAIKVWSLDLKTILEETELSSSQDSKHGQKIMIGSQPMKLLSLPTWNDQYTADGSMVLGTYLPLGDGLFKLWKLNFSGRKYLIDLGDEYNITPQIPDNYSTWVVNDFHLMVSSNTKKQEIQLSIMWKSNTSLTMYQTTLPTTPGQDAIWFSGCEDDETDLEYFHSETLEDDKTNYYIEKIFGPYGYTEETIKAALPIYGNHYAVQLYNASSVMNHEETLPDRVCRTVGTAVSLSYKSDGTTLDYAGYKSDLGQEWARFDRLCSELQRQGNEVLSLEWDPVLEIFWVVKALFTSVVRPAVPIELAYYNKSNDPEGRVSAIIGGSISSTQIQGNRVLRMVDAFHTFRRKLSHVHFNNILIALAEDSKPNPKFGTAERIDELYASLLGNQVSDEAYNTLSTSLQEIEELDSVLSLLHSSIFTNIATSKAQAQTALTTSGCLTASHALFEAITTLRFVVSDVLLVLLSTPQLDGIISNNVQQYSKYLGLFTAVNALLVFMNVHTFSAPENDPTKRLQNMALTPSSWNPKLLFFQNLILKEQTKFDNRIDRKGFGQFLNQLWQNWSIIEYPTAGPKFCAALLGAGNIMQAQDISSRLPLDSFSTFIIAHAFLKANDGIKARTYLRSASAELAQRKLTAEELGIVKSMGFSAYGKSSFGVGLPQYFLSASRAALSADLTITGLNLVRDAQKNMGWTMKDSEGKSEKALELAQQVYEHLFETGIKTSSYDDAYEAVVELALLFDQQAPKNSADEENDNETEFSIEEPKIIPYVESLASSMIQTGYGARLCQYPFLGLTRVISDLFLKKAQTSLIRTTLDADSESKNAFLYYNAFYAWNAEHNDFRGGKSFWSNQYKCFG